MPFDLASLEYAPLRRLKELASPYEFVKLNWFGLQHSLFEKVPNFTPLKKCSIIFRSPKNFWYSNGRSTTTVTKESSPIFLTCPYSADIYGNADNIDPILLSRIIMQPKQISLSLSKFPNTGFIFLHSCRKLLTELSLKVSNDYTFVGGEFGLIAETFPALEKLTVYYRHALLDWIHHLMELPLKKSSKFLLSVNDHTYSSMEDHDGFTELFDNAGPGFKLKLRLEKSSIAKTLLVIKMRGLSVSVSPSWKIHDDGVAIEIYKDLQPFVVKIDSHPKVFLDDYSQLEIGYKTYISDYFKFELPKVQICGNLTLSKLNKNSKLDQRLLDKNLHFKAEYLTIENCVLDNDIFTFTERFCDQVTHLTLRNVELLNNNFAVQLFKAFSAVETLTVNQDTQLPRDAIELLFCNDLTKLKCIQLRGSYCLFLKYLLAKSEMVKELFKRAHSSFYLDIDVPFTETARQLDKIRKSGFQVSFIDHNVDGIKLHVQVGVQEYITVKSASKEATVTVYPDKVVIQTSHETQITAKSPKIQLIADHIVLKTNPVSYSLLERAFQVDEKVLNKLVMQPTVIKLSKCVNEDFFELAEQFAQSVKHVDLRECACKRTHFKKQKKRIRLVFPNLIKIWDI